jgi:hypothetical protein
MGESFDPDLSTPSEVQQHHSLSGLAAPLVLTTVTGEETRARGSQQTSINILLLCQAIFISLTTCNRTTMTHLYNLRHSTNIHTPLSSSIIYSSYYVNQRI